MKTITKLQKRLQEIFSELKVCSCALTQELTIEVLPSELHAFMKQVRDTQGLSFDTLIDICGVDYLCFGKSDWETSSAPSTGFSRATKAAEFNDASSQHLDCRRGANENSIAKNMPRFASVYHLLSTQENHRLRVKVYLDEAHPIVPSVHDIWHVANWFEREAYDLFGILFTDHPDLRRILTDYGFIGHPLRKDFPTSGHVEVRYDATLGRVIYEPVDIVSRVTVPKVIRHDSRYKTHPAEKS